MRKRLPALLALIGSPVAGSAIGRHRFTVRARTLGWPPRRAKATL